MDLDTVSELIPATRDGWREGDAWLAGGTWLFSEPQRGLRRLLDLSALGWPPLIESDAGLEIAATCTLAQLAAWDGPPQWPGSLLVHDCCRALLGSFKIGNVATVGGNICLALPAGPMTSLAAALDGICTVWAPGGRERTLPASEFVLGPHRNALAPGELLRSVLLPARALRARAAYRQLSLSPLGRSAAIVIGRYTAPDGRDAVDRPRAFVLTVTASVPSPVRLAFEGMPTAEELREAIGATVDRWYDDVHGDPAWREHLTQLFAAEIREQLLTGTAL